MGALHWFTRGRVLALVAALSVVAAVLIIVFVVLPRPGSESHPNAPFEQPTSPKHRRHLDTFVWPFYGYTADRTRALDAPASLGPPFRRRWQRVGGRALLEFPPVISRRYLFELDDDAVLTAIDKHTGHTHWKRRLGALAAASPAVSGKRVFAVVLQTRKGASSGRVVAFTQKRGRRLWSRALPSRAESSPVVAHGTVYFGSEDGTLYALSAKTGRVRWTYHAAGAIKGGPALSHGVLYFGDYGGQMNAVRASNGSRVWTQGGYGHLYGTAAVAFGRVYIGGVDGRVDSFVARTGELAWAHQTGSYVYASPAVADVDGLGPTVFIGSYTGAFYAFNARSGAIRWTHDAGGRISGGATVVGDYVYFANLAAKRDVGLRARTGRPVFRFPDGAFNPVVSDGHTIFLVGYGSLYALAPKHRAGGHGSGTRHRHHARHRRHRHG